MAEHNETGILGEDYAIQFLLQKGFDILHRNWRFGHYEIDIIASNKNKLHFIEVKTRTKISYGYPEQAVTKLKLKHLMKSANHFLYMNPTWEKIQFDILSITMPSGKEIEYFYIEDIFL